MCIRYGFSNLTALRERPDIDRCRQPMVNTAAIDQYMKNRLEDPEKAIFYYTAVA